MISNIEIIKGLVREFYQTRMVVSIDNDDFESFFLTKGKLVAFDCEEFDLWNKPYKLVCKMTQDKLESLCGGRKIARVLFLVFQPTGHELQMTDMESLHLVSMSFETVTWGIGSWHEDSVRLVTLVEVVSDDHLMNEQQLKELLGDKFSELSLI